MLLETRYSSGEDAGKIAPRQAIKDVRGEVNNKSSKALITTSCSLPSSSALWSCARLPHTTRKGPRGRRKLIQRTYIHHKMAKRKREEVDDDSEDDDGAQL